MVIFQDGECKLFKNATFRFDNKSYIVSLDGNIIGHFNIIKLFNGLSIEYELLPRFRNKGLGNRFLKNIEDYVKANFEFEKILLLIKHDNKKSINVALYNNYKVDYNLLDQIYETDEMKGYTPYFKNKEKVLIKK